MRATRSGELGRMGTDNHARAPDVTHGELMKNST